MKKNLLSIAAVSAALLLVSCTGNNGGNNTSGNAPQGGKAPKYIFYFIGDGMSTPQINMAEKAVSEEGFLEIFNRQTAGRYNLQPGTLNVRRFTAAGLANTHAQNRFITCSAAAATALATGNKTDINRVSVTPDASAPYRTIAEMAHDKGMKVGIITSVSIDHATPSCFYAHCADRNEYPRIDSFLLKTNFEFFGGGFVRWKSKHHEGLYPYLDELKNAGYKFVNNRKDFEALKPGDNKVVATIARTSSDTTSLPDDASLPYNIDLSIQSPDNQIVLAEFLSKAVELLDNDDKGFFIMTEGGKIDWADHANDAVSNVYETIALDRAIGVALDFYKKHPDETLIVMTGDHECGGLTLGFAGTGYESAFNFMKNQQLSFLSFSDSVNTYMKNNASFDFILKKIEQYFGLGNEEKSLKLSDFEIKRLKDAYNIKMDLSKKKRPSISRDEWMLYYGSYEPITVTVTHILDNKSGVDWASFAHTALPVPVFAIGVGADNFNGYYDNTDIPKKIMQLADLK